MEYLKQFQQDLEQSKLIVRSTYVDHMRTQQAPKVEDVITDILDDNKTTSVACLPIAKQIVVDDNKCLCMRIPKIGDVFSGILNHQVIKKVTYILSNYLDDYIIEGHLVTIGSLSLWTMTNLPIPLIVLYDYEHINLNVRIELSEFYNLQNSNQEVLKACYGYFTSLIQQQLSECAIYLIPLLGTTQKLHIVCGLPLVDET